MWRTFYAWLATRSTRAAILRRLPERHANTWQRFMLQLVTFSIGTLIRMAPSLPLSNGPCVSSL